jgi:hypothetical protein
MMVMLVSTHKSNVGRGRAGRPDHDQRHCYHHAPTVKPEAATAVVEVPMMGVRTPETCWAINKLHVINLRNCCMWLVDLFETDCVIWNTEIFDVSKVWMVDITRNMGKLATSVGSHAKIISLNVAHNNLCPSTHTHCASLWVFCHLLYSSHSSNNPFCKPAPRPILSLQYNPHSFSDYNTAYFSDRKPVKGKMANSVMLWWTSGSTITIWYT